MFFYILLYGIPVIIILTPILVAFIDSKSSFPAVFECYIGAMFCSIFVCIAPMVILSSVWVDHANDLGTISAQKELVKVYEKEVAEINAKLSHFHYPDGALMNNDTPVASLVTAFSDWQLMLANARVQEAEAMKSIEQRRNSPMSGVIDFVGDYK